MSGTNLVNRRWMLVTVTCVTTAFLVASDAHAQQDSGSVFQALAGVDVANNNAGTVGCGGASGVVGAGGVELSEVLGNASSQGGLDDEQRDIAQRRALFRFCDAQTVNGANGWTDESMDANGNGIGSAAIARQSEALAPEELFAGIDGANASYDLQATNVARRLGLVRLARRGKSDEGAVAVAGRHQEPPLSRGFEPRNAFASIAGEDAFLLALQDGIQAGETEDGGLGFFLNGRVIAIDGSRSDEERGSDSVGGGFTLGVDRQLGGLGYGGGAFGYTRVDTSYDRSGSEASLDAYTFSLYGSASPTDEMYVDVSVTGSYLVYDSENEIIVFDSGPPIEAIEGDTNGGSIGADLGLGFDVPIEGVTLSPHVRLSVVHTILDDFKLTGGDGTLDLALDKQENTSLTTDIGFQLGYAMSTKVAVLTPYLRAAYIHEFLDETDDVEGSLDAVTGADFRLKPTNADEDYANFGVGIGATFAQGFSQFIDYDVIALHRNVTVHQVTMGLRLEF